MTVVIAHVQPGEAQEAFEWHAKFGGNDSHIFPRPRDDYIKWARNYQVVAAKEDGEYVGMCYYMYDDKTGKWEIGGLMVDGNQRRRGLGACLMAVTLGNLLIDLDPLGEGQQVIAHVIKGNKAPRTLITDLLKFDHHCVLKVKPNPARPLPTEKDGLVHGDEFKIAVPQSLVALAEWCEDWDGTLRDGTPAEIQLREGLTLADWAGAFRNDAKKYAP